ncbi:MAG: putative lipid II flippase FtsW [Erysipelotrichaceae bacterium]|nr:putative lipid II flippase FtsW [Erysipelotrichaceae bacterium]
MLKKIINNKQYNLIILTLIYVITFIGLYMVYSSSSIWAKFYYNDEFYYFKRQAIFILIGTVLLYFFSKVKLSFLRKKALMILLIGIISLILVIIPFLGSQINGSRSWFKIGPFLFQPAEFFKIIMVLYMADRLDKYFNITKYFFKTILVLLIPCIIGFILIMLQPDFGTAIVMFSSIIMMCFISKNKFKNYLFLLSFAIIAFIVLIIISPYRSDRIQSFINPFSDPLGSGFQTIQSLYAIAPGGLIGKGIDASYQKYFYLPEPQTDFIFAIFAEDFGFIGCLILIILYTLLAFFIIKKAINEKSNYKCFLDIGVLSLIMIQVCINLCVVVGVIPVTGITLPFMSYGGSSITMLLSSIGLLINRSDEINEYNNVR